MDVLDLVVTYQVVISSWKTEITLNTGCGLHDVVSRGQLPMKSTNFGFKELQKGMRVSIDHHKGYCLYLFQVV